MCTSFHINMYNPHSKEFLLFPYPKNAYHYDFANIISQIRLAMIDTFVSFNSSAIYATYVYVLACCVETRMFHVNASIV